jgi:hypothetical protein
MFYHHRSLAASMAEGKEIYLLRNRQFPISHQHPRHLIHHGIVAAAEVVCHFPVCTVWHGELVADACVRILEANGFTAPEDGEFLVCRRYQYAGSEV